MRERAHFAHIGDSTGPWEVAQKKMAPQVGLEPTTLRLTAGCSAIELLRSVAARPSIGRRLMQHCSSYQSIPPAENSGNHYLCVLSLLIAHVVSTPSLSIQFCPFPIIKDRNRHVYFRGFDLSSGACYKRLFCAELRSGSGLLRSERSRRRQQIRRGQAQHSYSCLVVEACSEPRLCPYPALTGAFW